MKKSVLLLAAFCCLIIVVNAQSNRQITKGGKPGFVPARKNIATQQKESSVIAVSESRGKTTFLPDADGDGVTDQFDQEPNTPANAPVDTHGVSRDTDGDGVPDFKDKELITPTQCQPVDADGIGKCPPPPCCEVITARRETNPESGPLQELLNNQQALINHQAEELNDLKLQLQELKTLLNIQSGNKVIPLSKAQNGFPRLKVSSIPNPTHQYFSISTQSGSQEPLLIRIFDVTGKLVEERTGIAINSSLEIGKNYRAGSYLLEVIQGKEKSTLRLIKLSN
jgi:hypothetical protein